MTKAKRQMQEDIRLVDLVIELLDARAPLSSRNPDIDTMAKDKSRLILLNKTDLADDNVTSEWIDYFDAIELPVCSLNCKNASDIKKLEPYIRQACKKKEERDQKRGIKKRPVRAMVAGIPNVGKSTFINSYMKKAVAKTGNKPGVTKGKQWVRLSPSLELLDTPGILWPKFEDQEVGFRLAALGSIRDEILNTQELACGLIRSLESRYPNMLEEYYGLEHISDEEIFQNEGNIYVQPDADICILYKIAKVKGALRPGGVLDSEKAAAILLENFRNGKIGKISLESPEGDRRLNV